MIIKMSNKRCKKCKMKDICSFKGYSNCLGAIVVNPLNVKYDNLAREILEKIKRNRFMEQIISQSRMKNYE